MFKKVLHTIFVISLLTSNTFAQGYEEAFQKIYTKFKSQKLSTESSLEDEKELKELVLLMDYLHAFTDKEESLNGGIQFGFSGDETEIRDLLQINAGVNIDYGNYPYQLDFSTSIQTIINNGVFQENVSNIDISFDYSHVNTGNGLWLENYAILKRFSDNYLGINQRYETGFGFIFNYRSKGLTPVGTKIERELNRKPTFKSNGEDLIVCYADICKRSKNLQKLTKEECETISKTRKVYRNANRKNYNRLRLALLLGIFYEIDQSIAQNNLVVSGKDSLITAVFPTQTFLRWEMRPTIEFQPNDMLKIKINPYFKFPLGSTNQSEIKFNNLIDRRTDYFFDLRTSIRAKVSRKISFGMSYRFLYDNAPNRVFLTEGFLEPRLLLGQQSHHIYQMNFGFNF